MRFFARASVIALLAGPAFTFHALDASPVAHASVSIAAAYEPLVSASDAVVVVLAAEHMSQWEDGKIYTYTKVRIEDSVAGNLGAGSETWVRTRGGTVGNIGQIVDGEPVFANKSRSLLFLRKGPQSSFEVSARAQGQYPVTKDERSGRVKLIRSSSVGVLFPAKRAQVTKSSQVGITNASEVPPVTAADMLHNRPLDEAIRLLSQDWKRLRKTP